MARHARRLTRGGRAGGHLNLVALPVALAVAGALAGCSASQAAALAHAACRDVADAGRLEVEARGAGVARGAELRARALRKLTVAEPAAARAAGADPSWQALSANLLEVNRLPTSLVMPALRADCAAAGVSVP